MRLVKQWLPVLLWAGLILSSANDDFSATQTGGWLHAIFGEVPHAAHVAFRKTAHVLAYGLLGALAFRADRRWLIALGMTLLVAGTDEWLQSRTAQRTGTPWDVALDLAAAGIVVFLLRRRVSGSPAASS